MRRLLVVAVALVATLVFVDHTSNAAATVHARGGAAGLRRALFGAATQQTISVAGGEAVREGEGNASLGSTSSASGGSGGDKKKNKNSLSRGTPRGPKNPDVSKPALKLKPGTEVETASVEKPEDIGVTNMKHVGCGKPGQMGPDHCHKKPKPVTACGKPECPGSNRLQVEAEIAAEKAANLAAAKAAAMPVIPAGTVVHKKCDPKKGPCLTLKQRRAKLIAQVKKEEAPVLKPGQEVDTIKQEPNCDDGCCKEPFRCRGNNKKTPKGSPKGDNGLLKLKPGTVVNTIGGEHDPLGRPRGRTKLHAGRCQKGLKKGETYMTKCPGPHVGGEESGGEESGGEESGEESGGEESGEESSGGPVTLVAAAPPESEQSNSMMTGL